MADEDLIPDETRGMIGMEGDSVTSAPVTEQAIRRFAYAIDDLNCLYSDPEYAVKSSYGGIIAPPFFYILTPFIDERIVPLSEHDAAGRPRHSDGLLGLPWIPLKVDRYQAGGVEVEFFQPIRPGDVLTRKTKLANLEQKEGSSGVFVLITAETTYTNQKGELVLRERTTMLVRH